MATCSICGAELPPRRKKYCSEACSREADRRKVNAKTAAYRKPKTMLHTIVCPDCGITVDVHIKSKRCAACQRAADNRHDAEFKQRRTADHTRKLGAVYACENCGRPYVLASGRQKWCPACKEQMWIEAKREGSREWNRKTYVDPDRRAEKNAHRSVYTPKEIVCAICGKPFTATHPSSLFCSDDCKRIAAIRHREKIDANINAKKGGHRLDINEILKRAGLNQTKLAQRFGIPLRTVQNWCGGQRNPPEYVLKMMDEILSNEKPEH